MKLILVACVMVLCSLLTSAQSWIFTYDNAGNRVRRELAEQKSMTEFQQDSTAVVVQNEQQAEISASLFPNPTAGHLELEIQHLPAGSGGQLQVFSLQGTELLSTGISTALSQIDLSQQPAGHYILRLSLSNGWQKEWRIVKIVNSE
mgnify:CR=1 FL=1